MPLDPVLTPLALLLSQELAHYATATTDLEFRYPFGWGELWGVANRGSSDLDVHAAATGDSLDAPHPTEEGKVRRLPLQRCEQPASDWRVGDGHVSAFGRT